MHATRHKYTYIYLMLFILSNIKASDFILSLGFSGFRLCAALQLQISVISMVYPGITMCVIIRPLQIR